MLNKSLYDIQADYANITNELMELEGELTPEMELALTINKDELEKKAEAYALRIIEFNGQSVLLKMEIERLSKRAAQYERTSEKLKSTVHAAMIQFNVDKIKTTKVTLSFRASESVEVPEDFADNIMRFVSIKTEIDPEKVKALTDAALEAGGTAPIVPEVSMLEYFKVSAAVDKAKIKVALKDGTTVGDTMLITKKNLQIK